MPAVGRISTNLSLKDVAGVVDFLRTGFLTTGFLTVGLFGVVSTFGFAGAVTFGSGATFCGTTGLRVLVGAGITDFFCTGPLPLRPSMTIFPSWV